MKPTTFRITFEDGETRSANLMPIMPATYIATVAPKDATDPTKFSGAYGIDWCEMDGSFSKIETFQNTKTSAISHVLDVATSQFKTGGTDAEKQAHLKKMYEVVKYQGKDYPLTWINLPKGKVVSVTIKAALISGTREKNDFLTIVKHPNFEISHDKTSDAGSNPAIKLEKIKNKGWDVDIKALNTFAQTEYIVIQDYKGDEVGKIEMAPNSLVNLNVKIVPVVFNRASKNSDAEDLYEKALKAKDDDNNDLKTTLCSKSLNQAGINCIIAPFNKTNPEYVFIDPSVGDWGNYYDSSAEILSDWTFELTDTNKPQSNTTEDDLKTSPNRTTKFLLDELKQAYFSKPHRKNFKGAVIFITDKSFSKATIGGYSESVPLKNQGCVIFKVGLENSKTYAHELAHMLGLEHYFLDAETNAEIADRIKVLNEIDTEAEKKNILKQKEAIKDIENLISEEKQDALNENRSVDKDFIYRQEKSLKRINDNIKASEDNIRIYDVLNRQVNVGKSNSFKVIKKSSKNFMDYYNLKVYFHKFQSEIIKQECIDYYQ